MLPLSRSQRNWPAIIQMTDVQKVRSALARIVALIQASSAPRDRRRNTKEHMPRTGKTRSKKSHDGSLDIPKMRG